MSKIRIIANAHLHKIILSSWQLWQIAWIIYLILTWLLILRQCEQVLLRPGLSHVFQLWSLVGFYNHNEGNWTFSLVFTPTSHRCLRSLDWLWLSHHFQAMQYMELIPPTQRPVSGTPGALERRRQLLSQLPVYDQDPMKCQSLSSEDEVRLFPNGCR